MPCTVIFELKEKPGNRGALCELLEEFFPVTRGFDGCLSIEAFGNSDDDGVLCVEQWASREHYNAYVAWRVERGDIDRAVQLCSEPPSVRFFDALPA
ncbi:MAG: antibiotic biosynthesis monooxygenase family protein [Caenibius sp.]